MIPLALVLRTLTLQIVFRFMTGDRSGAGVVEWWSEVSLQVVKDKETRDEDEFFL